jgi:hypothetical protein
MTSRPQVGAAQAMQFVRSKTWANIWRVERKGDGFVLRFSDHDRRLVHEGETYEPLSVIAASAERRDAGMRPSNVELSGFFAEDAIQIPDVLVGRYRGAKVRHRIIDFRRPWLVFYDATRRVTQIEDDGGKWLATLDGYSHQLQQQIGGRFGGVFKTVCGYTLGDRSTCRALFGTNIVNAAIFGGTATATTHNTLSDTGQSWGPDALIGLSIVLRAGTGQNQVRIIKANTTTQVTVDRYWDPIPDTTSVYRIGEGCEVSVVVDPYVRVQFDGTDLPGSFADDWFRDGELRWTVGDNDGTVSVIESYRQSTREVLLRFPTPFEMQVGDRAVVVVGCDGLKPTCQTKFANVLNFGGSPYEPGAGEVMDPPTSTSGA